MGCCHSAGTTSGPRDAVMFELERSAEQVRRIRNQVQAACPELSPEAATAVDGELAVLGKRFAHLQYLASTGVGPTALVGGVADPAWRSARAKLDEALGHAREELERCTLNREDSEGEDEEEDGSASDGSGAGASGSAQRGRVQPVPLEEQLFPVTPNDDSSSTSSSGGLRLFCGSWNMGAKCPFEDSSYTADELSDFLVPDCHVYVIAVQEGVSDRVYDAVEAATGCMRLHLGQTVTSPRPARGVSVAGEGKEIPRYSDRVLGRGDGSFVGQKFTGIAAFVRPSVAGKVRLLGAYSHSFGAREGSKGAAAVALGLGSSTLAFLSCHLASKRLDLRREQYGQVVEAVGNALGHPFFQLNESFHHVVWMGDYNYKLRNVQLSHAVRMLADGKQRALWAEHDELVYERAASRAYCGYREPVMGPAFYPTYKKFENRGHVPVDGDGAWLPRVYRTRYKEPFYKGGQVKLRLPGWCDRVQVHSLPDCRSLLVPEPYAPRKGSADPPADIPCHNYRSVNNGMDVSDHSPVYTVLRLTDREALGGGVGAVGAHPAGPYVTSTLCLSAIRVDGVHGGVETPRHVRVAYPLPHECALPAQSCEKQLAAGEAAREGITLTTTFAGPANHAAGTPHLHAAVKVHMGDSSKGHAVLALPRRPLACADGRPPRQQGAEVELVGECRGSASLPLSVDGVPLVDAQGQQRRVSLSYHAHYRVNTTRAVWAEDCARARSGGRANTETSAGAGRAAARPPVEPSAHVAQVSTTRPAANAAQGGTGEPAASGAQGGTAAAPSEGADTKAESAQAASSSSPSPGGLALDGVAPTVDGASTHADSACPRQHAPSDTLPRHSVIAFTPLLCRRHPRGARGCDAALVAGGQGGGGAGGAGEGGCPARGGASAVRGGAAQGGGARAEEAVPPQAAAGLICGGRWVQEAEGERQGARAGESQGKREGEVKRGEWL